jgi:hypothetical protein
MTPPNGEEREEGPPPTYTPWLVVRANPGDKGSRPLPAGTPWFLCPDLHVAPADAWGRVNAGDTVTVSVTVQNLGRAAATGVRARFWWVDPSGGVVPATSTLIGDSSRVSIAAGLAEVLECRTPWIPRFVNGGHECLVVEVSSLSDPLTTTFRADLDRHVGQRNVTVLAPGGEQQRMMLTLTNPFSEPAQTTLHVQTALLIGFRGLLDFGLYLEPVDSLLHFDDPSLAEPMAALGLERGGVDPGAGLAAGDPRVIEGAGGGYDEETQRLLRARRDDRHDFGRQIAAVELPPEGRAIVELTVDLAGGDGAILHRLTQVTDGVDVGGYGVLALPV